MEEKGRGAEPLGKATWLLACGLGLQLTWVASLFYGGAFFRAAGIGECYRPFYLASMTALIASLLILALIAPRPLGKRLFDSRCAALLAAGVAAGATLLSCLGGLDSPTGLAFFVSGAALTGVGSAFVTLSWGLRLSARQDVQPAVALLLAYAFSIVAYYLIAHLPSLMFVGIASLAPLASIAMAFVLDNSGESEKTAGQRSQLQSNQNDSAPETTSLVRGILLASLVFGMVQGTFQTAMGLGTAESPDHSTMLFLVSTVPLVGIAALLASNRMHVVQEERFAVVYRVSLLAMIGALLVESCLDEGSAPVVLGVVLLTGYTLFKVIVWTLLCQISRVTGISPIRVFGLGEAILTAGLLLSNSALAFALQSTPLSGRVTHVAIAVGIALLLMAYLFVLTERHVIVIGELAKTADEEEQPVRFRFQAKVDEMVRRFGLTEREAEIARLFVRGRSSARIAEDLCISSGTVTTHLRNVYKKVGVHSRQELLDLLDEESRDALEDRPRS